MWTRGPRGGLTGSALMGEICTVGRRGQGLYLAAMVKYSDINILFQSGPAITGFICHGFIMRI